MNNGAIVYSGGGGSGGGGGGGVRVMVTHDPLSRESKPCVAGCYTE